MNEAFMSVVCYVMEKNSRLHSRNWYHNTGTLPAESIFYRRTELCRVVGILVYCAAMLSSNLQQAFHWCKYSLY